VTVKP